MTKVSPLKPSQSANHLVRFLSLLRPSSPATTAVDNSSISSDDSDAIDSTSTSGNDSDAIEACAHDSPQCSATAPFHLPAHRSSQMVAPASVSSSSPSPLLPARLYSPSHPVLVFKSPKLCDIVAVIMESLASLAPLLAFH